MKNNIKYFVKYIMTFFMIYLVNLFIYGHFTTVFREAAASMTTATIAVFYALYLLIKVINK